MTLSKLLWLSLVVVILFACKKTHEPRRPILFSGIVKDSLTLKGIGSVVIKSYWYDLSTLKETVLDSTITDEDGNYTLETDIDAAMFKDHAINVLASVPGNYVSPLDVDHATVGMTIIGIQSTEVELVTLYLYQKAQLTIQLKRTVGDVFSQFYLHYNYQGPYSRNYWILSNVPSSDTSFNVVTAAGMSTNVLWEKMGANGLSTTFIDSIRCLPGAGNVITVNY